MELSITDVLRDILVVLVAAKLAGEISERVGIPPVVGEIVAGVIVGRSGLGLVGHDEVLLVFAELGVILLLVQVGMEMDVLELRRVGFPALRVAVAGVVLPFAGGFFAATALGAGGEVAVFAGAALTATSVGITARVFGDMKALASVEARTVLGAAIADDVIGLVILTVVLGAGAAITLIDIAGVAALAVSVLALSLFIGSRAAPALIDRVQRLSRSAGTLVGTSLAFILVFSLVAQAAGLAPIVGAFVAGLVLARTTQSDRIKNEMASIGHVFIPVFFLQIGIDVEIDRFLNARTIGLAAALLLVAVAGKVLAGWAAGRIQADRWLIGLGMLPRGEVGLIFAGLGLRQGILEQDMYGALLLVVLATTLMTPPLLRWKAREAVLEADLDDAGADVVSGPLIVSDGIVELGVAPPPGRSLEVAFEAALALAGGRRPGHRLLDHLASQTASTLRWNERSLEGFFRVLRDGSVRSWRFLETSTVLDRVLPELAEVLRRRQADRRELDAARAFQWTVLERLHDIVRTDQEAAAQFHRLARPDVVLLASLVLDATPDRRESIKLARRLSARLSVGASAEQELARICGNADLLRAALSRPDALEETPVLHIAAHVGRAETARALYLVALAQGALEPWQRLRLDELHGLVQATVDEGRSDGKSSLGLVEVRRETALAACMEGSLRRWIETASAAHLIAVQTEDLLRHARLMDLAHRHRRLQVAVGSIDGARWFVELAAPDKQGLLARTTGALMRAGMNIAEALAATEDGIALQSFRLSDDGPPDRDHVQHVLESALAEPLRPRPVPDADIRFNGSASPWATLCEVRASDREGLLNAIATAFALAGISVRSLRTSIEGSLVVARFELVGRKGGKVPPQSQDAIAEKIREGGEDSRSGWIPSLTRLVTRNT